MSCIVGFTFLVLVARCGSLRIFSSFLLMGTTLAGGRPDQRAQLEDFALVLVDKFRTQPPAMISLVPSPEVPEESIVNDRLHSFVRSSSMSGCVKLFA